MNKKIIYIFFIVLFIAFAKAELQAQCAMCRAVLESESDGSAAKGINNGIVYLMAIPYVLVGGVIYAIYHSRKKEKKKV